MNGFSDGYSFFEKNAGGQISSAMAGSYVDSVSLEIDKLLSSLNHFEGYSTCAKKLKGDIAEFWHAGTFNINSTAHNSQSSAEVYRSHDFASADVVVKADGKDVLFGLKYDATAIKTAQEQSKSIFERFRHYKAQGGVDTLEKFLSDRGYDDSTILSDPIYKGQIRIIPKEQFELAQQWLKRKISEVSTTRPEEVFRYQETLELLDTKLSDNKGVTSIELTKEEATRLAELAKNGDVTLKELEKLGVSTQEIITYKYVLQEAFKAGLSSAIITLVLKVAPELLKSIVFLIEKGYIDKEQLKNIGVAAIKGTAEGFLYGSVSAAITAACKSGLCGSVLKNLNPSIIGTITVLAMNTIRNTIDVALGKKSKLEVSNNLVKDVFISSCSLVLGGISQCFIEIPIFGFMIGSFIGSMIGSFTYSIGYKGLLSFCVDTGFTLFGLVKQDYELPRDVIEQIGGNIFELEQFTVKSLQPKSFSIKTFQPKLFDVKTFDIKILRRGVISVSTIGYK